MTFPHLALRSAVIAGLGLMFLRSVFASANGWYDHYVATDQAVGDRCLQTLAGHPLYRDRDSSDFAWGENYVLRSYLLLYWQTGETRWLDKLRVHLDALVQAADDDDHDGYRGWSSMQYSPALVADSGFEDVTAEGPASARGWKPSPPSGQEPWREQGDHVAGKRALHLRAAPAETSQVFQDLASYDGGVPHVLRFHSRTVGAEAVVRVVNAQTGAVLQETRVNGSAWTYREALFITPTSKVPLRLVLEVLPASDASHAGEAWFDEVVLTARVPYLVHQGLVGTAMADYVAAVETLAAQGVLAPADPNLAAKDRFRQFLTTQIIPQWEDPKSFVGNTWHPLDASTGSYQQPTKLRTMATTVPFTNLPYNQMAAFLEMLHVLEPPGEASPYRDRVLRGARYFQQALVPLGPGYTWNYGYYTRNVEDTSHANLDVALALRLFRDGDVFDGGAMQRFVATLTTTMWNHDLVRPVVAQFVDGRGDASFSRTLFSWTDFAQFDPRIWRIAAEQFRHAPIGSRHEALTLATLLRWDPARVVNRGFEFASAGDPTLPARWTRHGAGTTARSAFRDSAHARRGRFGLTLRREANAGTPAVVQPWTDWTAGHRFRLEGFAQADAGASGTLAVVDAASGTLYGSVTLNAATWSKAAASFTLPESVAGRELVVRIALASSTTAGAGLHVDGVRIVWDGDPDAGRSDWDAVAGY